MTNEASTTKAEREAMRRLFEFVLSNHGVTARDVRRAMTDGLALLDEVEKLEGEIEILDNRPRPIPK